jgi:hypothetical protein
VLANAARGSDTRPNSIVALLGGVAKRERLAMLQRIETVAELSVGRGCGFAAMAILTFMVGLSGEMRMSFQCGGYLTLLVCFVLILKATRAYSHPYKQTELWLMLEPKERPDAVIAQRVIGTVLRDTYLRFALHAALLSAGFLVAAVVWGMFGLGPAA